MAAYFDEFGLGKDVLYQKRMDQLREYNKFSKKWEKKGNMNRKVIRLLEDMETGPASEIPDGGNTAQVEVVCGKEGTPAQHLDAQSERDEESAPPADVAGGSTWSYPGAQITAQTDATGAGATVAGTEPVTLRWSYPHQGWRREYEMRFVKGLHELEGLDQAVKIARMLTQHKQKELDKMLKSDQKEFWKAVQQYKKAIIQMEMDAAKVDTNESGAESSGSNMETSPAVYRSRARNL